MNFKQVWQRLKYLFLQPNAELEKLRGEKGRMGETYFILLIFCALLGLSALKNGWRNSLSELTIWYLSILISTVATCTLAPKFGVIATWAKSLKINVFAVLPLFLSISLANLINHRLILLAIGSIYSIYILYLGIKIILSPNNKQCVLYTLVVLLAGVIANYVSRVLIP